jgi:putative alpha-1,2-mannosidase
MGSGVTMLSTPGDPVSRYRTLIAALAAAGLLLTGGVALFAQSASATHNHGIGCATVGNTDVDTAGKLVVCTQVGAVKLWLNQNPVTPPVVDDCKTNSGHYATITVPNAVKDATNAADLAKAQADLTAAKAATAAAEVVVSARADDVAAALAVLAKATTPADIAAAVKAVDAAKATKDAADAVLAAKVKAQATAQAAVDAALAKIAVPGKYTIRACVLS